MNTRDFGYDMAMEIPPLPSGFYACRAETRVPCLLDVAAKHIRFVPVFGGLATPHPDDRALNRPGTCLKWPRNNCLIATDLPGYGTQDFTSIDEGGTV